MIKIFGWLKKERNVDGFKKIKVISDICEVTEEERDHYYVNYYGGDFIVRKEFLVRMGDIGFYRHEMDFSGRMMAADARDNGRHITPPVSTVSKPQNDDPISRRLNAIK